MIRLVAVAALAASTQAFVPHTPFSARTADVSLDSLSTPEDESAFEKFVADVRTRTRAAQKSASDGGNFKQVMADFIASEYDADAARSKIEEATKSAPCVMFTWEASPSCKQALRAMELVGADVKVVRLDDPWDEGNPIRAELGKMTGKSSVPSVWIGGKYVGGYNAGVSEDAPGLVDLAFKGTLRPMIEAAQAEMILKAESSTVDEIDVVAENDAAEIEMEVSEKEEEVKQSV